MIPVAVHDYCGFWVLYGRLLYVAPGYCMEVCGLITACGLITVCMITVCGFWVLYGGAIHEFKCYPSTGRMGVRRTPTPRGRDACRPVGPEPDGTPTMNAKVPVDLALLP